MQCGGRVVRFQVKAEASLLPFAGKRDVAQIVVLVSRIEDSGLNVQVRHVLPLFGQHYIAFDICRKALRLYQVNSLLRT